MAASHFQDQWCSAGPYLFDQHRANGIAPVDGCRHCALLNRPPKTPVPGNWRPWQAPEGGAITAPGDPMPEWGERDARKVLSAAYGGQWATPCGDRLAAANGDKLAGAAYIRCRKMAAVERYKHARYYRLQEYVSIAALQGVEKPALRQASPGEVSNAVRNAIVDAERKTSLNGRHLTRKNGKEQWENSLDTLLLSTKGDDTGNSFFEDLTADIYWRKGYGNPAEWQEQADAEAVDAARREYLLWEIKSRLDDLETEDLTGFYAFRLHEIDGKTYREIAKILAISPATAQRASERMKARLKASL